MKKIVVRFFTTISILLYSAGLFAQAELVLPSGHTGVVRMAGFSPDNKSVITGGEDKTINVWETFTGLKLKTLSAGLLALKEIGFTADGKYIYAQTDSSLSIWSVPSYKLVVHLPDTRDFVISPDMKAVYAVDFKGALSRLSLSGKREWILPINGRGAISVSSDSKYIAVVTATGVSLVDDKGKKVRERELKQPHSVSFLPGGKTLAVITPEVIYRYEWVSDLLEEIASGADRVYFSETGRYVVLADELISPVRVFDLHVMKEVMDFGTVSSKYDTMAVQDPNGEISYRVGSMNISVPGRRAVYNGIRISDNGAYLTSDESIWTIDEIDSSYEIMSDSREHYRFRGSFSRDNRYLLVLISASQVGLWDLKTKTFIQRYKGESDRITYAAIDQGGKKILSVEGNICKVLSTVTGKTLQVLDKHTRPIGSAIFSPDGSLVLTNSFDTTACLWNANTGVLLQEMKGHHYEWNPVYFGFNGELVQPSMIFDTFSLTDPVTLVEKFAINPQRRNNPANFSMAQSKTGKYNYIALPMTSFLTNSSLELSWDVEVNAISPDEKIFAMARHWTDSIMIGDPAAGKWLKTISVGLPRSDRYDNSIVQLLFSPGGDYLFVTDIRMNVTVLSVKENFRVLNRLPGEMCSVSQEGDLLLILNGGKIDLYNAESLAPLYSYVSMGEEDYLVVDEQKRYDGSPRARKFIYFTCENEVIGVDQFKDRLWVPGLAGRIISKDSIYTPGIDKLNICGFTPRVQPHKESRTGWDYDIIPGSGGLGETVVFVNGVEVKRIPVARLAKTGSIYQLRLDSSELRAFYVTNSENRVSIRAFTSDNTVSSRGLERKDSLRKKNNIPPNLYAVMIGVSDYKGETLDLKYAAKDAADLGATLKIAAGKLLNTDGGQHVFVYSLTTGPDRYRMPEKLAIRKTLEEIGAKATPNDILLIFFAGHGIMYGDQKQFYFLTSEASDLQSTLLLQSVGVSTSELTEWIRPDLVKAQKRILIFDACNSGQAIKDFVKFGKEDQGYAAARNDDRSQQARLIEKMNDRAGFTILSAAATNQSAYELGQYAQGLLTFALLKTVKEQPDILLNGNYLDIGRWFQASKNTVENLVTAVNARQEPQFISNTSFVIGKIDEEVLAAIKLPREKPVFTTSILTNSLLTFDNLGLSRQLNAELRKMGEEEEGLILYQPDAINFNTAYSINGNYNVTDGKLVMQLRLIQGNELKDQLNFEYKQDEINELFSRVRKWISGLNKTE